MIKATNSAKSKAAAARAAYETAIETAEELKRRRGWSYVTMRPRKVKPDPFWKAVRPVVTPEMLLKPDVVTRKTYSQCWKGVVVPYVCTAGVHGLRQLAWPSATSASFFSSQRRHR